jgi:hypothetical protein
LRFYRSANIVRVIKPRRLRWAGHVARMEEVRSASKILTSIPTGNIIFIDAVFENTVNKWEDSKYSDNSALKGGTMRTIS